MAGASITVTPAWWAAARTSSETGAEDAQSLDSSRAEALHQLGLTLDHGRHTGVLLEPGPRLSARQAQGQRHVGGERGEHRLQEREPLRGGDASPRAMIPRHGR